jgi:hypothetical protein
MQRHSPSDSLNQACASSAHWFRRLTERLARRVEWETLSPDDRRQLSADTGLSEAEMNLAVRTGNGSGELMALLARPALRQAAYPLDVLRDMQRVCTFCPHHRQCRDWQAKAGPVARWPAFCPNAFTFASLPRSTTPQPIAGKWP